MKARTTLLSDLGDILHELVRVEVAEQLRQLGVTTRDYTRDALPACTSLRIFNETCRKLPGATKEGRSWRVERSLWHKARSKKPAPPTLRLVEPDLDVEKLTEMALAGARAGRRAGR